MSNEGNPLLIPGPIILFGSGETTPSGRKVFEKLFNNLPPHANPPQVALLETPAGFEPNSAQVIGKVAEFIQHRLQNFQPQMYIVPARKRGIPDGPDNPQILTPLIESDVIFMGPGSPTYAVRQLRDTLAWEMMIASHYLGAALVLASAATIAVSAYSLPVYEIYKVGEDLHWKRGLDLFSLYGLPLIFIPHWNNNDGGEELDTSRCFMGQARFAELMAMLPPDLTVMGIDEHTALYMDLAAGTCSVIGRGGVTLLHTGHAHPPGEQLDLAGTGLIEVARQRNGHVHQYSSGHTFPLSECCPFHPPNAGQGISAQVWQQVSAGRQRWLEERATMDTVLPSAEVLALVEERQAARERKDWQASDVLREQIASLGWQVLDTPEGPKLERLG